MTYTQWVHTEPYSSWLVQGKMCLISSDLIAFPLVRLAMAIETHMSYQLQ